MTLDSVGEPFYPFPHLRRAHCHGLALWVYGTLLAQNACQNRVSWHLVVRLKGTAALVVQVAQADPVLKRLYRIAVAMVATVLLALVAQPVRAVEMALLAIRARTISMA